MTKIMFFGTRDYEKEMALNWGKKNNVEVTTSKELLSSATVDQLKDYDGVTTMQFGKLENDVYPNKDLDFLTYKDSVKEAIKDADIISLHVPANKESYHLFDKAMFDHVKKGAILVNAARGAVINTPDLIDAVNDGTLLGAAIDTYENEAAYFTNDWTNKDIDDKTLLELIEHERILVTPHIAFFSDEAVQNLVEGGLNAALSVINTGTCETRLN
ncbi:TPA: hypothetical protein O2G74_000450 [Staphylococcus aureus]|nr:hypothetical protein [Staphylococcus aureus]